MIMRAAVLQLSYQMRIPSTKFTPSAAEWAPLDKLGTSRTSYRMSNVEF